MRWVFRDDWVVSPTQWTWVWPNSKRQWWAGKPGTQQSIKSQRVRQLSMSAKLLQSCLTLCGPMDCSLPSSSVHGILRARILEWVACPPPGHLPKPGIKPMFLTYPAFAGRFFTTSATWEHPHVSDCTTNNNNTKRRNQMWDKITNSTDSRKQPFCAEVLARSFLFLEFELQKQEKKEVDKDWKSSTPHFFLVFYALPGSVEKH